MDRGDADLERWEAIEEEEANRMKNFTRRVLKRLVRYLAPRVGLGVFEIDLSEPDNSPEAVAFLAEEHEADWEFYWITLH